MYFLQLIHEPSGRDALGKLRPTAEERKAMSPEFDLRWETFFVKYPDKPVITMCSSSRYVNCLFVQTLRYRQLSVAWETFLLESTLELGPLW